MRRSILLALVVTASFGLSGCDDNSSVKGVVKLDGTPVEGATVTFVSEDGNSTYIGVSDASGNFTLTSSTGGKKRGSGRHLQGYRCQRGEVQRGPHPRGRGRHEKRTEGTGSGGGKGENGTGHEAGGTRRRIGRKVRVA